MTIYSTEGRHSQSAVLRIACGMFTRGGREKRGTSLAHRALTQTGLAHRALAHMATVGLMLATAACSHFACSHVIGSHSARADDSLPLSPPAVPRANSDPVGEQPIPLAPPINGPDLPGRLPQQAEPSLLPTDEEAAHNISFEEQAGLRRTLDSIRRMPDAGRAVEAAANLGRVAETLSGGQQLIRTDAGGTHLIDALSVTQDAIASLPEAGQRAYLTAFSETARRELADALRRRDWRTVASVAATYTHTPAGSEAYLRLATLHADRGHWIEAAACRQRATQSISAVAARPAPAAWVDQMATAISANRSPGCEPFWIPRWTSRRGDFGGIADLQTADAVLPASRAVFAAGQLLLASPAGFTAYRLNDGQPGWTYHALPLHGHGADYASPSARELASNGQVLFWVDQLPWPMPAGSAVLDALPAVLINGPGAFRGPIPGPPLQQLQTNTPSENSIAADVPAWRISALAVAAERQGKQLWQRESRSLTPAGMALLGPPAVRGDTLALLVEFQSQTHLLLFDSRNGRERERFPLATVAVPLAADRQRQDYCCALHFQQEMLYCNLGGGQVVAFDLLTRRVRWTNRIPLREAATSTVPGHANPDPFVHGERRGEAASEWQGPISAIVQQRSVVRVTRIRLVATGRPQHGNSSLAAATWNHSIGAAVAGSGRNGRTALRHRFFHEFGRKIEGDALARV